MVFSFKDEEISLILEFTVESKITKDDQTIVKIKIIKNMVDDNTIS